MKIKELKNYRLRHVKVQCARMVGGSINIFFFNLLNKKVNRNFNLLNEKVKRPFSLLNKKVNKHFNLLNKKVNRPFNLLYKK